MMQSISSFGPRRGAVALRNNLSFRFEKKTNEKHEQAEQTTLSAIQAGRRAALTKAEIEAAPETAATWAAVGRA